MNLFIPSHQEMIEGLLGAGVAFMLIGGYAVNYHGYVRSTGDMDIWLKPDSENKVHLLQYLEHFGIDSECIDQIQALDFSQALVFSINEPPDKIDFITKVNGVDYNAADKHKELLTYGDLKIPFIGLDDLVLTKIMNDRLKDKADVEMLQKIAQAKNKK